jgi:hypothetical protein
MKFEYDTSSPEHISAIKVSFFSFPEGCVYIRPKVVGRSRSYMHQAARLIS